MPPKIERIMEGMLVAEAPHWDGETQSLLILDIYGNEVHKYEPETKAHTKATISGEHNPTFIIPVEDHKDKFVITQGKKILIMTWDGKSDKISNYEEIAEVDMSPETSENKLNDGKCDASGRLWTGSRGEIDLKTLALKSISGSIYSLGQNREIKKHVPGIGIANGLSWNLEGDKFYYIDSNKRTVDQYDFDQVSGTISNPEVIFTLEKHDINGLCDGMTTDTDGNLWIAIFNGYSVIKIDPRNPETLLDTIRIPAKQVTSVAFGGLNMDELYVTTARLTINDEVLTPPENGAVYKVTEIGCKGFPGVTYKM